MPGNVSSATSSTVMPLSLSRLFEHSREYTVRENEYLNGESQRRAMTSTSRKYWRLSKRLTPTEYDALLAFFVARNGPVQPFYFYDGTETVTDWSWDATGVSTTARYTVVFRNQRWVATFSIPRHEVDIELTEVA